MIKEIMNEAVQPKVGEFICVQDGQLHIGTIKSVSDEEIVFITPDGGENFTTLGDLTKVGKIKNKIVYEASEWDI